MVDLVELGTLGLTDTGELTGSDAAAAATKKASNKQIDFSKWIFGEQEKAFAPYTAAGEAGMGDVMSMLGFTNVGGSALESDAAKKIARDFITLKPTKADEVAKSLGYASAAEVPEQELAKWLSGVSDEELKTFGLGSQVRGFRESLLEMEDPYKWERDPTQAGTFTGEDLYQDPSYQFRLDEGMKGVENSAAARGGMLSGAALKDITRFGQDYASTEYGNAYNRWQNDLNNRFNLAGIGQASAAGTSANLSNLGANVNQAYGDIGAADAAKAMAPWNTAMDIGQLGASFYGGGGGGKTQQQKMLDDQWS